MLMQPLSIITNRMSFSHARFVQPCLQEAFDHPVHRDTPIRRAFILGGYSKLTKNVACHFQENKFHHKLFNPDGTMDNVLQGVEIMKGYRPNVVVGVGDGVCVDAAKLSRLLYDNPKIHLKDKKIRSFHKKTDLIMVPTISSAGAEMTPFVQYISHTGIWVDGLQAGMVVRSNQFMRMDTNNLSYPGLQVLLQGMECLMMPDTTPSITLKNTIRDLFSTLDDAIRGNNYARGVVFQCMGGIGVYMGNTGLGTSTCMALKLAKYFNVPVAMGMAILFPHVLRRTISHQKYNELALLLGIHGNKARNFEYAIDGLRKKIGIPPTFYGLGIDKTRYEEHIHKMARETISEVLNPHPLPMEMVVGIYKDAY